MKREVRDDARATTVRRCAIYTRKSTEHGLDQVFTSLDAQRDACEAYIRSRSPEGWQALPDRYEDGGYTGKDTDRPAFQKLMADVDAGHVDVIVVYKLDRLTRSVLDFARLMERLDEANAAFVSITESFSTTDAVGRLILHVLMSFAEFEREQIAARTRDKVRAARRRGLWTGGSSPYGYRIDNKRLVVEPETAPVGREVFTRYLACESAVQVAQDLNGAGHLREVRRRGALVSARPWTKNDVLRVLENPLYVGLVPCGEELHDGIHEPLVDRATWQRVKDVLARNRGTRARQVRDPSYLLRGVLRCARCGAAMSPAPTVREDRTYRYYRCGTRDKGGKSACAAPQLAADPIESVVTGRLRQLALDRALQDDILAASARRLAERRAVLTASERTMPRQLQSLDADVRRLAGRLTNLDGAAAAAVEEQVRAAGADKERLELRLVELRVELARLDDKERELGWARELLGRLDRVWELLAPENRARLVSFLVDQVVADGESGAIEIHLANLAGVADTVESSLADAN